MINKSFWESVAARWTIKDTTGRSKAVKDDVNKISNQSSGEIPQEFLAFGASEDDLDDIDECFDDI